MLPLEERDPGALAVQRCLEALYAPALALLLLGEAPEAAPLLVQYEPQPDILRGQVLDMGA